MSSRRHKRRRVEKDTEPALDEQHFPSSPLAREAEAEAVEVVEGSLHKAPSNEADIEVLAKEQEIWDTFREEHYEGAWLTVRVRTHKFNSIMRRSPRTASFVSASRIYSHP